MTRNFNCDTMANIKTQYQKIMKEEMREEMTNLKNIEIFIKRAHRMKGDDSIVTRKEKQREDLI